MKRLTLFLLVACRLCTAQYSQTLFQQALNNTSTLGPSAVMRNIGQQYHQISVFGNSSCTNAVGGELAIESSNNGISYSRLGVPLTALAAYTDDVTPTVYAVTNGVGAYQYIRVNYITAFPGVGCKITVWYAGTVTGTPSGSAPYTAYQDTFQNFISSKATAGEETLVTCPTGTGFQLYSFSLFGDGGANTVTLRNKYVISGGGTIVEWALLIPLTATNPNLVISQGSRPYYVSPGSNLGGIGNDILSMQLSAATDVSYSFTYRCE